MSLTLGFSMLGIRLVTVDLEMDLPADSGSQTVGPEKVLEHVTGQIVKRFSRGWFKRMVL